MKKIMFTALLFVALPAYPFGWDRDYESCVLNHIEDAKSDTAAMLVRSVCRKKFPMTEEEECLQRLKGNLFADAVCSPPECENASYWSKHFGDCKPD